jgi:hypothetical protein
VIDLQINLGESFKGGDLLISGRDWESKAVRAASLLIRISTSERAH